MDMNVNNDNAADTTHRKAVAGNGSPGSVGSAQLLVIAYPGLPCPKEENPRDYITDSYPMPVPNTMYYRRRIAEGSLKLYEDKTAASGSEKPAAGTASPARRKAEKQ
jgi:hypothetical protein